MAAIFEMVIGILVAAGASAEAIEIVNQVFNGILGIFGA